MAVRNQRLTASGLGPYVTVMVALECSKGVTQMIAVLSSYPDSDNRVITNSERIELSPYRRLFFVAREL
jgi:hypothetical protein